jgi:hypothetical protein
MVAALPLRRAAGGASLGEAVRACGFPSAADTWRWKHGEPTRDPQRPGGLPRLSPQAKPAEAGARRPAFPRPRLERGLPPHRQRGRRGRRHAGPFPRAPSRSAPRRCRALADRLHHLPRPDAGAASGALEPQAPAAGGRPRPHRTSQTRWDETTRFWDPRTGQLLLTHEAGGQPDASPAGLFLFSAAAPVSKSAAFSL